MFSRLDNGRDLALLKAQTWWTAGKSLSILLEYRLRNRSSAPTSTFRCSFARINWLHLIHVTVQRHSEEAGAAEKFGAENVVLQNAKARTSRRQQGAI